MLREIWWNDERDEQYESAEDNIEIDGDELDAIIAEATEAEAMDQEANEIREIHIINSWWLPTLNYKPPTFETVKLMKGAWTLKRIGAVR